MAIMHTEDFSLEAVRITLSMVCLARELPVIWVLVNRR